MDRFLTGFADELVKLGKVRGMITGKEVPPAPQPSSDKLERGVLGAPSSWKKRRKLVPKKRVHVELGSAIIEKTPPKKRQVFAGLGSAVIEKTPQREPLRARRVRVHRAKRKRRLLVAKQQRRQQQTFSKAVQAGQAGVRKGVGAAKSFAKRIFTPRPAATAKSTPALTPDQLAKKLRTGRRTTPQAVVPTTKPITPSVPTAG